MVQDLLQQYSKQQAFTDASGLMALNLKQSQEANAPAIAKSIEGLEPPLVLCKGFWLLTWLMILPWLQVP